MRVLIRYADKSLFDGEWTEAPVWQVQTIAYIDPVNSIAILRHQGDFYYRADDGSIIAIDAITLMQHMEDMDIDTTNLNIIAATHWAARNGYLIGSFIGQHDYQEVYQLGKQDRDSLR